MIVDNFYEVEIRRSQIQTTEDILEKLLGDPLTS